MKKVFNLSSKYNTIAAMVGGGLLAIILIFVFLIRPAWASLQKLGNEIPQEQQARDLKEQELERLEKAKAFLEKNAQTVEQVNTAVPIDPEVPSILVSLESLAKQSGVFLTSFSPQQVGLQPQGAATGAGGNAQAGQPAAAPGGVDSVEITANFRGPYTSLITFLYNLERSLRIVDVKTITVNSAAGDLEGNISFKAYYKKAPGAPAPAAAATPTPAPTGGTS